MNVKLYITMSFSRAEEEVKEWLQFFLDHGINLVVEEIQVAPKAFGDYAIFSTDEIGFEPVLAGKTYGGVMNTGSGYSYDDYFRIEEILTTGKYRFSTHDEKEEEIMCEVELDKLDYSQARRMLIEWSAHMLIDGIKVRYKLPVF